MLEYSSEGDAEIRLLEFLQAPTPDGLGFKAPEEILSKPNIKAFEIDKGTAKKRYSPDFIIIQTGIPFVIVEVKKPGEDLSEAIREAGLYAYTVNGFFPSGINPARRVVATDGDEIAWAEWDTYQNFQKAALAENTAFTQIGSELREFLNAAAIREEAKVLASKLVVRPFFHPRRIIGQRRERRPEKNPLGETITIQFENLIAPTTREERAEIVKRAYVHPASTRKSDSVVQIIQEATPHTVDSGTLSETRSAEDLLTTIDELDRQKSYILLLTGVVGSGKSTFLDYIREVRLPSEGLTDQIIWITVDMNVAMMEEGKLYSWLADHTAQQILAEHPDFDFELLENQELVFADELSRFKKGPVSRLSPETDAYNEKLYEYQVGLVSDPVKKCNALIRYFCIQRRKACIIVIDNADKYESRKQLQVFEAAQWVRNEFRSVVIVCIRDTTYQLYRHRPPLDTAIPSHTFHVKPARFTEVMKRRIQLILEKNQEQTRRPRPPKYPVGSLNVVITNEHIQRYLDLILSALSENNQKIGRLITGIAGRNLRDGLSLFLSLCRSGHLVSRDFVRADWLNEWRIPDGLMLHALMRGEFYYYSNETSPIANLFNLEPKDTFPSHFSRCAILEWLRHRVRAAGEIEVPGFFSIHTIIKELTPFGYEEARLESEIISLINSGLLVTENYLTERISAADYVKISSSGLAHLDLVKEIPYLFGIAEDIWYRDEAVAKEIVEGMNDQPTGRFSFYHPSVTRRLALLKEVLSEDQLPKAPTTDTLNPVAGILQTIVSTIERHEKLSLERQMIRNQNSQS